MWIVLIVSLSNVCGCCGYYLTRWNYFKNNVTNKTLLGLSIEEIKSELKMDGDYYINKAKPPYDGTSLRRTENIRLRCVY